MPDKELVREILSQIDKALETIKKETKGVENVLFFIWFEHVAKEATSKSPLSGVYRRGDTGKA